MRQVVGGLVEQDVAEAPAEHDAERGPGQEIIHLHLGRDGRREPGEATHHPPADDEAHDIGERIPADGERPDLDQHRIKAGVEQNRDHEAGIYPVLARTAL